MSRTRLHAHLLAAFLQLAPLTRVFQTPPGLVATPALAVLRWIFGAAAVAGSFHGVSGATGVVPQNVRGTNGARSLVTFTITSDTHGTARSYSAVSGVPQGLSLSTRGTLSGTPTNSGVFNMRIRGWETATLEGDFAEFVIPVAIVSARPPQVAQPPADTRVRAGQNATFTVGIGGDGPIAIRWFLEDLEVRNATNATLVITNAQPANAGRYRVRLINDLATVFSDFVTLAVDPADPPPGIARPPAPRTVHQGETVVFDVAATGSGLSYQWSRGGAPLGPDAPRLVLTNVTPADAGPYAVRVAGVGGVTNTPPAPLVVLPPLRFGPPVLSGGGVAAPFVGVEGRPYGLESAPDISAPFVPSGQVVGRTNGPPVPLPMTNGASRVFRLRTLD